MASKNSSSKMMNPAELIWRNGPVAMAVSGERSRRGSPPFGTFLEEEIFKEEEMAWFLQYQIDDDCGGGRIGGKGCRFAAPIVDEAGEGEEQRIDVELGQGNPEEKVMDSAPIVDEAAEGEEQRIDMELGQEMVGEVLQACRDEGMRDRFGNRRRGIRGDLDEEGVRERGI